MKNLHYQKFEFTAEQADKLTEICRQHFLADPANRISSLGLSDNIKYQKENQGSFKMLQPQSKSKPQLTLFQ